MFKSAFFCVLLAASAAFASPSARRLCGNELTDDEVAVLEADFAAKKVDVSANRALAATIPVHFHVIQESTALSGGNVPNSQLTAQINVLNDAYSGSGLSFSLASVEHTTNANWFRSVGPGTSGEAAMKQSLRTGGANALNVYTVGFESGAGAGLLGYATFPSSFSRNPTDDGVVMLYSSLPGGSAAPFNLGGTLIHEAGHWVGLFHTFQGGCSASGDSVSDTPPEAEPNFGCPSSRDTCSGGGTDPIHNYMDYSDDICYTEFTAGQIARLQSQMATFRGVFV